jgi:hypothetical protein
MCVEFVEGRCSVVICWRRIAGGCEDGIEWMRRGTKSSWEREQWIVAQEKKGK